MHPSVFDPYYRPVAGVGADELPLAEQAVLALLVNMQPVGLFTPWATIDGEAWKDESTPQWNYLVYPISSAVLTAAEKAGGGSTGFIVVLTDRVIGPNDGKAAFEGSRYEWFETDAVYRQDAPDPTPSGEPWMHFLVWGRERDPADTDGGAIPPETVASKLSGALVFAVQQGPQPSDRRPGVNAATAMAHQFTAPPRAPIPSAPSVVTPLPAAVLPSAVTPAVAAHGQLVPVLMLLGVGAGATYLGYRWMVGRRRTA